MKAAGYQIDQVLYEDMTKIICRGCREYDNHPVIIKMGKSEAYSAADAAHYIAEFEVVREMHMQGITKPLSLERRGTSYILVSEDVAGMTLRSYLTEHRPSIEEFLQIAIRLAGVVEQLHQSSIIHRDLKPDTIMIETQAMQVCLIDFGTVMVSKGGHRLLAEDAISALKEELMPLADIITPNIPEAEILTEQKILNELDMKSACISFKKLGVKSVLLKGGHLSTDPNDLFYDGENFYWVKGKRVHTKNTHGTGCTLSSAIAANLAKGNTLLTSVQLAKAYIEVAIEHSLDLGNGHGPTNHFYELYKRAHLMNQ